MEKHRIWKDAEEKDPRRLKSMRENSLCFVCLKIYMGCCHWTVSNEAGGFITLKNFSSLDLGNRVLFLRWQLQIKPEFPRRGWSRWSGIVPVQKSLLSRGNVILNTKAQSPINHKDYSIGPPHGVEVLLALGIFLFAYFCFVFLSKRTFYSSFCSFIPCRVTISVCPRNADRSKFPVFVNLVFYQEHFQQLLLSQLRFSDWASQDPEQRFWYILCVHMIWRDYFISVEVNPHNIKFTILTSTMSGSRDYSVVKDVSCSSEDPRLVSSSHSGKLTTAYDTLAHSPFSGLCLH